jgi:hypothetical protein
MNWTESGAEPVVIADTNEPDGAAASAGTATIRQIVVTRRNERNSIFMAVASGFPARSLRWEIDPAFLHLKWRHCFNAEYLRCAYGGRENLHWIE